jgi:hypothetical protein
MSKEITSSLLSNVTEEQQEFLDTLTTEQQEFLIPATIEIEQHVGVMQERAFWAGKKLVESKERLSYGEWAKWLKLRWNWSVRTAQRFIAVYQWLSEQIGTTPEATHVWLIISSIKPSGIYLLASKSTPDAVRDQALALAREGEAVNKAEVERLIDEEKAKVKAELKEEYEVKLKKLREQMEQK